MKIDTELQEDHQLKLTVEMEADVLEGAKRKAAKKLAKRVKIPGFRPGKAPYNVIQRHIGDGAILEDAIDIVLEEEYPKILEEAEVTPYGPGALENIASMDPPTFEFKVPLAPEVELGEYREIRIDFEEKEVTDKDIQDVIENLRDQQAVIEPAERPAEEGDMVYIVLDGEREEANEEGETKLVDNRRVPVVVEKADADADKEWPYPGFSRELIGLSAEDEKELEFTFPKDYELEDLQNQKATFKLTVEEVKGRTLPEVDEEFIKSLGEYEDLVALQKDIRESLEKRFEEEQNANYESQIIDELVESASFKFPPQMLEHEVDHFVQDLERSLPQQGLDMETYLKSRSMDAEALREELQPNAVERLHRSLALMEVGNQEGISVESAEVEAIAQQRVNEIVQMLGDEQARQFTSGENLQGLVSQIMTEEITTRTLSRLRAIAKGEDPDAIEEDEETPEETSEAEKETPEENQESEAEQEEAEDSEEQPEPQEAEE
ncbi:MAG: trigger factor [Chloroflexi bacterium]|nr:trigger factor [Chloroflexota bacterium]